MSNKDYEKLILAKNLGIKQYEKIPTSLKKVMQNIKVSKALAEWRKRYDIKKIFHSRVGSTFSH